MGNILVCKKQDCIIISKDGKKFIINKDNIGFNQLKDLTKDEIITWYLERQ